MAAPLPALGLERPELLEGDLPPGAQGECALGWREAARAGGGGERRRAQAGAERGLGADLAAAVGVRLVDELLDLCRVVEELL